MGGFVLRVVVADDHAAVRESLRQALLAAGELKIVGEAATGREALHLAVEFQPDVVVTDLHMPDMDGIAAAAQILDHAPRVGVVLHSLAYTAPYVFKALAAGVRGFVAKADGVDSLVDAVRLAWVNQLFLSPTAAQAFQPSLAQLFSAQSSAEICTRFDREAPRLWQLASAVAADPGHARDAVLQSFLSWTIARLGGEPIADSRRWLLLSVIASLFDQQEREQPAPRSCLRSLFPGHADPRHLAAFWNGTLPEAASGRLRTHLRSCPSCHLEWCLIRHANPPYGAEAPEFLRATLSGELRAADLRPLAQAWSLREKQVRVLMASELRVMLGSAAADDFTSATAAAAPIELAGEFLGSRVQRTSSGVEAAMPRNTGLSR